MTNWKRIIPFENDRKTEEIWIYKDTETEKRFNVSVTLGKPVDILSLKENVVNDYKAVVDKIKDTRSSIYKNKLKRIELCPICNFKTTNVHEILNVYGAMYCQCKNCSHCFVIEIPTKEILDEFYSKDTEYHKTYTSKDTIENRLRQVAFPKAQWVIDQYKKLYGRAPKSILDIGAGAGHFVYSCRKLGITADGIEVSKVARAFCKEIFGLELINSNFLKESPLFSGYELITFWGVIEHVSYPLEMLKMASKILSLKEGLIAVEVPRWNSFSTTVQNLYSDSVVRHLDPLGHINCFTDSSLATAFMISDFDVVSAWYFGMDVYELAVQISYLLDDDKIVQEIGRNIPSFQERLDLARLSDGMVFAGKPSKTILN